MGWSISKMSEVTNIISGGTPKSGISDYWFGDVKWITPKDMGKITGIYVSETGRNITQLGLEKSSAKLIPESSVILSTRAPIGHLAINKVPMATNQGCRGLVPKSTLDTKFLYYFLLKSVSLLNDLGSGTTFKELSKTALEKVEIPHPEITEQKRIVAILDQAFADIEQARAKTEQNLKNARELFESYLQQVFSQRGEGWVEKKLGEAVIVERGSSPRPIKKYQTDDVDGVNWVKIGDTKEGQKYIERTKERITRQGAEKSRFVDVGDFILSNSMSFGRPYIMAIQGYIHDGWFVLRLPEDLDSEYFYYLLSSPYLKGQFQSLAAGAIVKNISGDLVKKAILPIPPIQEQKRIAQKLAILASEIEKLEEVYRRKANNVDELKQSILQKAFSGELTKTFEGETSKGAVA